MASVTEATAAVDAATAELDPPLAALHLPSLRANLADLRRRAAGTRIRIASKSVRSLGVLREVLGPDLRGDDAVRGIMAYSLSEALWLVEVGCDDVLLGYPTVDRSALRALAADDAALAAVTLMVDNVRQLEIARDAGVVGARVCIDVDGSLRLGPVHLGVRRSPLRDATDVEPLVRAARDMGFRVVGAMFYEAQVAGVPDNVRGIGVVKRLSMRRLVAIRQAVAETIEQITGTAPEIINSGGSGSVAESASAPAVTEVTAGSGLYVPGLFDHYRTFTRGRPCSSPSRRCGPRRRDSPPSCTAVTWHRAYPVWTASRCPRCRPDCATSVGRGPARSRHR